MTAATPTGAMPGTIRRTASSRYVLRTACLADAIGIGDLSLRLGEDPDIHSGEEFAAWWRWMHIDNPAGAGKALVATDADGRSVGHCGLVPFQYQNGSETMQGGFICQLMVDTPFRKSLLFPNMETRLLRESPTHGFDFCFGLVNRPEVIKAHVGLGFRLVGSLPVYARPYRLQRLIERRLGVGAPAGRVVAPVVNALLKANLSWSSGITTTEQHSAFGSEIDALFARVAPHFRICGVRSATILNWRFMHAPKRRYQVWVAGEGEKPVGYITLRRMSLKGFDVLVIVDLFFDPERHDVGRALVSRAHRVALAEGVEMSACLMNATDPLLPVLKRAGFMRTPESLALIVHAPRGNAGRILSAPLEDWHLTWFDHDYN